MNETPEVCPKCGSQKESASYRFDCNGWTCLSDFGVTKNGEFTQSFTCQLRCANQQITQLQSDLAAANQTIEKLRKWIDSIPPSLAAALAAKEQAERERDELRTYRDKMEDAHGAKLYAVEKLLDHFTEDGELKGEGQWRIREIWQCCKDFDEGSERAAKLFNGERQAELADLRDKLAAIVGTYPQREMMLPHINAARSILHPQPPAQASTPDQ